MISFLQCIIFEPISYSEFILALWNSFLYDPKYPRFLILSWEKEYLQTKRLLNATSHFLISHIVGHLLEFIKISLGPPILKIDNFT